MATDTHVRWIAKPLVWGLCLVPLVWLMWQWWGEALGPNPVDVTNRYLGEWALRFLLITLAVTPFRKLLNQPILVRFRRMLGLFAFAYVLLHLISYIVLDQFFDWDEIWRDITKRWYITVGMFGFIIILSLARTPRWTPPSAMTPRPCTCSRGVAQCPPAPRKRPARSA